MKSKIPTFSLLFLALTIGLLSSCKKNDDDPVDPSDPSARVLVIDNGAQSMNADESANYSASWVSTDGTVAPANGVNWSSSASGVATISGSGSITVAGVGSTTITASITEGGTTYSASVPLGIVAPTIFAVAPSAIIWDLEGGPIQLETVYFGTSTPSYSFSSSNASVASVSNSGMVSFNGLGECVVTVTSSAAPSAPFLVPVLVVGPPAAALPVVRVEIDPASADIFRGESLSMTATAFNADGPVSASFSWASSDPAIASVDANGRVTGNGIGRAYIRATASGITGQAEVIVNPDTVVVIDPLLASIPAGGTKQFSATAYNARAGMTPLSGISNFDWFIPSYGIPMLDVATVNSSGLVTVNSNALVGNATVVTASIPGSPESTGGAFVMVSLCDCGNGNPAVASISAPGSISLSLFGNPSAVINATANDAGGSPVSNPELRFCSDNISVANVDEVTGEVFATGPGDATITICSGGYAETTVQVNVAL